MDTASVIKNLIATLENSNQFVAAWGNNHASSTGECNVFAKRQLEKAERVIKAGEQWLEDMNKVVEGYNG